jgi:transposase
MSHAGSIVGISELEIERVDRNQAIHVWAYPRKRPACVHCQHAPVRIKASYERTLKHTRLSRASRDA